MERQRKGYRERARGKDKDKERERENATEGLAFRFTRAHSLNTHLEAHTDFGYVNGCKGQRAHIVCCV